MISTSGTTGIPKCVSISYENLNNFCKFINHIYPLSKYKNINVLNTAMFSFDLSVCDIFYSVTNNHTLVALTKDEIDDYNKIFGEGKYLISFTYRNIVTLSLILILIYVMIILVSK